ncbi:hypothetical protein [Lagierella sp.]|uniref:hypothetical protein n=1 Tax=Lagierella sp. TaxID=2849657 RepID=UPI00262BF739|nr:hypothetical protein [Lagierella sp.]
MLIYNNPNLKVKDYNISIVDNELYIDLDEEKSNNEPMRFYEVCNDVEVEEFVKKHDIPKKIHVLENGKEMEIVYFENVEIK